MVCVCVCGALCVVMGLDRLIGVSWVFVCVGGGGGVCVFNRCWRLREKEKKKKKRLENLGKPKVSVRKK